MPQFTFNDASGTPWTINAPTGTTEAQAFAQFQSYKGPRGVANTGPAGGVVPTGDTSGMSTFDRVAANLGAGVSGLVNGGAQFFGAKQPGSFLGIDYDPTPQGVAARRALDATLANSVTGGGALQTLGEQLPFMAIPFGSLLRTAGTAGRVLTNLGRVATGADTLPWIVNGTRGLASAIGENALQGAAQGALTSTEPGESRTANATLGGLASGALTGVIGGAGKGLSYFTPGAAVSRAGQRFIDMLGGNGGAQTALDQVGGYGFGPPLTRDIPMTTAELTGNPALVQAQRTAQMQNPTQWVPFRDAQAQARFGNLQAATQSADNLSTLADARNAATQPLRDKALTTAGRDAWFDVPVRNQVAALANGNTSTNPATRSIVNYVQGALDNGVNPQQLYTVRKVLTDGLNGPTVIGDPISNAAKMAGADTMKIVGSIDDALNTASNGQWQKYLDTYAAKSGAVNDASAAANVRDWYARDAAPQLGGVPQVTGANLGRAIDKFGANGAGWDQFTADTRARLQALQDNLEMTEGPQKSLRLVGTSGGGSNTPMDLAAAAGQGATNLLTGALGKIPIVSSLLNSADAATKSAVNDALINPDLFTAAVSARLAAGQKLSPSQDLLMRVLRSTSAVVPQRELSPQ